MTKSGQATYFRWRETTFGQIPSPAPDGTQLRLTSEDIKVVPTLQDSPEITPGDEPQDAVLTGYEGGGNLNITFSPRNFDEYLEELFGGSFAWQSGNGTNFEIREDGAATVTYTAATRTLTTSATWDVTPAAGDKILVQGSGNAYLDGIHTVDPTSTPTTTAIVLEQDGILSDTTKVPNIGTARNITIIRGERLTNSLTPAILSSGLEKRIERTRGTYLGSTAAVGSTDIDYKQVLGLIPTRIQVQATGENPFTGQIALRASREQNSSSADGSSTTVVDNDLDYEDTPIFQGADSVKKCRLYMPDISAVAGDAGKLQDTLRICPQSLAIELANGLQETKLMCAEAESDFQHGTPLAQFTVAGIYETPFPVVAFTRQIAGQFEVALVATNGDGYLFRCPRAKVTLASADVTGRGTTILANMTVQAFRQTDTPIAGDSARAIEIYRFRQPA
jgi:hypothetical protein